MLVKFSYPVAFRFTNPIAKDSGFLVLFDIIHGLFKQTRESAAVKDVVSQNEANVVDANEFLTDDERLSEPIWARLLCILEMPP